MSAVFPGDSFAAAGLNRQHIFALADLPDDLRAGLQPQPDEQRLILLGHAGRQLWDGVQAAGIGGAHPIDDYCRQTIARILAGQPYRLLYPGKSTIDLQALGTLAGWHHTSPFMVGIDAEWGSWFAYRAVILCAAEFPPTPVVERRNPCPDCPNRPCVAACPAKAAGDPFRLDRCIDERLRPSSPCIHACLARNACPVGAEHRYSKAQMRHSYALSLSTLRQWRQGAGGGGPENG
ncbi:hypothetical protein [Azonexus sp.]|uniref:hypothetical protein n=1 Tax=Azonexus sp. TaxID=1872668 RepID=UPI002818EC2C|nr:hypothetical protein [Azonexus sp.]MDR1994765.1 hypothetical protein [Azonexus sp.]